MTAIVSLILGLFGSRKLAMGGVAGVFLVARCFVPELQAIGDSVVLTILGMLLGGHVVTDVASQVVDANKTRTVAEVLDGGRRGLVAPIEPPK